MRQIDTVKDTYEVYAFAPFNIKKQDHHDD